MNLLATWQLAKANRESMNIEGSFQHLVTDLLAFVFTAIAGAVILTTGFARADGIASLVIAAIMFRAAYGLLRDSGRVLLEAAPEGMDVDAIGRSLAGASARDERPRPACLADRLGLPRPVGARARRPGRRLPRRPRRARALLHSEFGIDHTTLQVDHARESSFVTTIGTTTQP